MRESSKEHAKKYSWTSGASLYVLAFVVAYILEYFIFFINGVSQTSKLSEFHQNLFFLLLPALVFAFVKSRDIDRILAICLVAFACAAALTLTYTIATAGQPSSSGNPTFLFSLVSGAAVVVASLSGAKLGIFSGSAFEVEMDEEVNVIIRTWGTGSQKRDYIEQRMKGIVVGFRETLIQVRYEDSSGEIREDWFDPWQVKRLKERSDE